MADYLWKGIDVSVCQQNVDFNKVKAAGYSFVIIRIGDKLNRLDTMFEKHYKAAKAAGLLVGAYWYAYAKTTTEAKLEATSTINALKGKQFEMPIFYDIERRAILDTGRTNVSNLATTFCNTLEEAKYYCGIYGGQELAQNYLTETVRTRYCFWYAQYLKKPRYTGPYGIWQFGVAGAKPGNNPTGVPNVPGVPGECDMDYCYVDYPTKIKEKGMNGFTKTPTPEPVKTNPYPEPTTTVKEGDTGDSVKWLQWYLTEYGFFDSKIDGSFGNITLGGLLSYQFKNDLEVDGKCGPATRNSLKNYKK